jgi:hypothetical protein
MPNLVLDRTGRRAAFLWLAAAVLAGPAAAQPGAEAGSRV